MAKKEQPPASTYSYLQSAVNLQEEGSTDSEEKPKSQKPVVEDVVTAETEIESSEDVPEEQPAKPKARRKKKKSATQYPASVTVPTSPEVVEVTPGVTYAIADIRKTPQVGDSPDPFVSFSTRLPFSVKTAVEKMSRDHGLSIQYLTTQAFLIAFKKWNEE